MNRIAAIPLCVGLVLGTAHVALAQAPPAPASSTASITPNFRDVPIEQLAEAVGQATNRSFVVAPNVRAQVSLINPRPMTPTELYYAFLSILQVHGFAAVPSGNVVKIVQETNARQLPGNDLPASLNGGADEMVTTVIEVKNINANQLATVLRQLLSANALLQGVPGTNSLVITDRQSNVARIQKIINRVDQTSTNGIDVIRLEHATAADIVRTLTALMAGQQAEAAAGLVPRIAADDRSNSILVSGDPAQRLRVAAYVAHLDTPLENGGGTERRYLKFADAEKVAAKLKEQATGIAAQISGAAPGAAAGAAAAAASDRSVTILAYKETNTLIITAPPKMMRELLATVDALDIPRAQVVVEAIIADVSTDKSADLGVNWAVFSNEDGTSVPAGGFISPVGNANSNPVSIVDLTKSVLNPAAATTVPLGATFAIGRMRDNGINFAAMIRALRADANTNVIATPQLTATDNQEASFESALEVPFITGQYTNSGTNNNGSVNPFQTVQRQKVGTILKITPQINDGNTITLNISLESSELVQGATGDAGSPITNSRSFTTSVRVEDGSTIVAAGMIRDSKRSGESRVPFLGRIPLIGQAFKVRNGTRTQSNLMVFIRPKILADSVQATIETNQKYNLIRDAQRKQNDTRDLLPLLPGDKPPQLPPTQPPAPPAGSAPAPAAPPPAPARTTPVPAAGESVPKQ
jgi:general secretion pathway protein D